MLEIKLTSKIVPRITGVDFHNALADFITDCFIFDLIIFNFDCFSVDYGVGYLFPSGF